MKILDMFRAGSVDYDTTSLKIHFIWARVLKFSIFLLLAFVITMTAVGGANRRDARKTNFRFNVIQLEQCTKTTDPLRCLKVENQIKSCNSLAYVRDIPDCLAKISEAG